VVSEDLKVVLIDKEEALLGLKDSWACLWNRLSYRSVFQRFEWVHASWQWLKLDARLCVFAVYDKDEIVAIVPFVSKQHHHRKIPVRMLELLSIPDNQECDALVLPEYASNIAKVLAQELKNRRRDWDLIRLKLIPEGSFFLTEFPAALQKSGLAAQTSQFGNNPGFTFEGTWEQFYKRRSRRLKKGNNLVANKLKKAYEDIRIEWLKSNTAVTDVEFDRAIEQFIGLSKSSWKVSTGLTLDQVRPREFIKKLSEYAKENDWLSIWLLFLDGKPVAGEYQLICEGRVYALRADYDEAFSADSPGTYLNWKMLEQLFENNLSSYEMGPGRNAYKKRWAEVFEPRYQLTVYGKTIRSKVIQILDQHIVPLGKKLRGNTKDDVAE